MTRRLRDDARLSTSEQARLAKQRESFLESMADFEATNRTLRRLLRDQHRLEASGLRLSEQRDVLMKKLADSDMSNEVSGVLPPFICPWEPFKELIYSR